MLPPGQGLLLGRALGGAHMLLSAHTFCSGKKNRLFIFCLFILVSAPRGTSWPYDYRYQYNHCPGPEWNVMCRGCCEYDVIRCKCPLQGTPVGYAVPCCRNAINECDPCIIHPGCSIFENCKRCNNGTWQPRDNFFVSGKYCSECRPGWTGGDCKKCGGVIHRKQGHIVLESYPNNARCEWTIQVERPFAVELRFMMLSLESHHSCHYDYVEVRDGDSVDARVIGRFCGNSRPPPVHSSGSSLHILFVSDGYKNFDGFFATFQEISACSSSPCLHDGTCILDSSRSYHCACLGGYTGKNCEHVVGCLRPPVPKHGSTEGIFYHSGARVTFRCDPGFQLRGFRSAVCLSDGTWSAPAPECVPVERVCVLPPKPAHGDHFLVYGPNDVLIALQYLCYQPYELSGSSQRTCLPNSTWSGIPPVCTKVNNTLTKAEKDKDKPAEGTPDTHSKQDIGQTGEKSHENATGGKERVTGKDTISGHENTTAVGRGDTYIVQTLPGKAESEGEPDEIKRGSGGTTGGSEEKGDGGEPDNKLNTVERQEPEDTQGSQDTTGISGTKDKGQREKERKELQVNGKREPDKVGPNDTKLKGAGGAVENTVEVFHVAVRENSSVRVEAKESQGSNSSIGSPDGRKAVIARANVTQYTMYRAGEEGESTARGSAKKDDKTEKSPAEERREELEEAKEREKEANLSFRETSCPPLPRLHHGYQRLVPGVEPETVEFFCNHSYALSGDGRRSCQADGVWSGRQPSCVRACREPKVSELVIQRVLPLRVPSRKTPVDKLYSSGPGRTLQSDSPTKGPPVPSSLPQGFHQLYTQIEYECASQYYQHFGSSRRTCLKTGKWSGRHVSCSPVCGKHATFDPERPADSHWPWLAAIYRRSNNRAEKKVTGGDGHAGSLKTGGGAGPGLRGEASEWQLVCSGALVSQRSVVVAAHCVAALGKAYPVDAARLKVVVGKHFRDDRREDKGPQHLRVDSVVVHENYDPHVLDSDVAVIRLLDKAKVGERVAPLCLSDSLEDLETGSGRGGLVTGWSPVPDSALGPEEKARVGLVHLAHVVPCEQQYARNGVPVSVTDNMLCASQKPDYGSNICPSDTGGILVLPPLADSSASSPRGPSPKGHDTGRWRLLGLVSFGYDQGECDPDLYTVYTHVAHFKDWVESSTS